MKIAALFLLPFILLFSTSATAETSFGPQHDKVMNYFIGADEPKVKDALWTSPRIFKVGVLDDGKKRDGFAEYVCQVLYDYGFKGKAVWVHVIDIARLVQRNDWKKLGEAYCE